MRKTTLLLTAVLAWSAPASAQFGLKAAEGTTSFVMDRTRMGNAAFSVLAIDTEDESLNLVHQMGAFGLPQEWVNQAKLSLSAPDGERDLFAGGRFVPGLEFKNRLAWSNFAGPGFRTLFGSVGYEVASNAIARYADGGTSELVLEERTGHRLSLGAGANWAARTDGMWWGVSAEGKWGRGVPVAERTSQVCFTDANAPADGQPARVDRCAARYFGGVHDDRSAHLRLDWQSPYWPRRTDARLQVVTAEEKKAVDAANALVDTRKAEVAAARQRLADAAAALRQAWRALGEALDEGSGTQGGGTARSSADRAKAAAAAVADATGRADQAAVELQDATGRLEEAEAAAGAAKTELAESETEFLSGHTVTVLAAVSTDLTEGNGPRYNVAVGPALHPGFKPLNVVGALLFELSDFTDPGDWKDRFAVRLYLGVPFGGGK
jgi:hypothetical protein